MTWTLEIIINGRTAVKSYDTWAQAAAAMRAVLPKVLPAGFALDLALDSFTPESPRAYWTFAAANPPYRFSLLPNEPS